MTEIGYMAKEVKIKVFRSDPRENMIAIVEGPAADLVKIVKKTRIKIGWTIAVVREIPRILRCFKCHGLGHMASACNLRESNGVLCRKCGEVGHVMRDCDNPPKCRLCLASGLPIELVGHVAASVRCPRYKEALLLNKK